MDNIDSTKKVDIRVDLIIVLITDPISVTDRYTCCIVNDMNVFFPIVLPCVKRRNIAQAHGTSRGLSIIICTYYNTIICLILLLIFNNN